VPVCDPREFYECTLPTQSNYVRENEAEKCNCRRQCSYLSYETTVSQSLLSDSAADVMRRTYNLPGTLDEIIREHCVVEVSAYY